ncbi:cytochrome P450 [Saccharata proteae CBS 121410]|uniref:Cytochrome P450 n=1 Tax=Saccharata proteae CBS 121410 TaxID=1314787 RepID=A0A9P4HT78_9PEZI|nr:cytochrome P450 [Saccharata proteae CBS 121410]
MPDLTYLVYTYFLLASIPVWYLLISYSRTRHLPNGPTPLPIIGNKLDLAKYCCPKKPWLQFEDWARLYGPIYTIWIGRSPTIIVSDPNIAVDLLEKRSTKYSSRPRMVAMGELLWEGSSMLVQPYGKEWSMRRKLLHQALTPKALRLYKPVQEAEASRLCFQLLGHAHQFERMFERFTASVVFCVAYGHRIDSLDARVIRERFEFMRYSASLNVPGKYMVETFPVLKYVPDFLAPWKKEIKRNGKKEAAANMALVNIVRNDIVLANMVGAPGSLPDSLCKLLLETRQKQHIPLSERDFSFIPASLFGAGSDTTASTLCTAILAFVTHPTALRAAQEEIDTVVGLDRTPTFADESELPYICALVKEVLRWRPVAVLGGTPHASTEDDRYGKFFIPRGTTILVNSWAVNLNPEYYPDPHRFEPSRFLPDGGAAAGLSKPAKEHPSKTGHSSFGWGRRICPGADLAVNTLFVALAKLIWGFNIRAIEGREYDTFAYTDGFNIRPQRFDCAISVRSEEKREVLHRENQAAQEYLKKFTPCGENTDDMMLFEIRLIARRR